MESSNLPKQLSASDILKETTAKELACRNLHVSFSDDVKTHNISHPIKQNKPDDYSSSSCSVKEDENPNLKRGLKQGESSVNVSAEYGYRASSMRSKIEEKISEIEEKMSMSTIESSTESMEFETGTPDYNTIKVKDPRRFRSCSVSEMRQSTIDRLQSKLEKAEKELELREEEVARLRKIRDEVGSEIEDLTASLFEEANNMVRNISERSHKSEKRAKEANMKLTMLQEEVGALKFMLQSVQMCPLNDQVGNVPEKKIISQRESYEVDPIFNKEFVTWRQNPIFDKESPFFKRIYEEDIYPCLTFKNSELAEQVISAIDNNQIIIEKYHCAKNEPLPKTCALLDAPRLCPYKMYLDGKDCYNISTLSRNRITSICDLFCYFRYIEKGLISLSIHEVYLEILKKRRRIASAKLGLTDDVIE